MKTKSGNFLMEKDNWTVYRPRILYMVMYGNERVFLIRHRTTSITRAHSYLVYAQKAVAVRWAKSLNDHFGTDKYKVVKLLNTVPKEKL